LTVLEREYKGMKHPDRKALVSKIHKVFTDIKEHTNIDVNRKPIVEPS